MDEKFEQKMKVKKFIQATQNTDTFQKTVFERKKLVIKRTSGVNFEVIYTSKIYNIHECKW